MAIVNPCNLTLNPKNTGVECDSALYATAMLMFMPRSTTFTQAQINAAPYNGNFTAFILDKIHNPAASRWFPIFGTSAPIQKIEESNETDVIEPLDDGSSVFIRYGKANRTFSTTKGGYCLAAKLMQFPQGYSFIEVDINGQVAVYQPTTGNYAGFPTVMLKGLSPDMANLKTSYKNRMMISFDKVAYFVHGKMFSSDTTESLLGLNGLLDADVTLGTGTQSTTNILFGVSTDCGGNDLVALYTGTGPGKIGQISNFVVTAANGTVITPSAVAIVGGQVQLTGVYTTGTSITVALAAPAVLKTNGLPGYEGLTPAIIPIP